MTRTTAEGKRSGDDARRAAAVAEACRRIASAESEPSLAELAKTAGMSAFHFLRVFKQITGLTPKSYAKAEREGRVRELLAEKSGTVTDALYEAGYNSGGRFYADAKGALGMTAKKFRAGGKGEVIRFAVGRCSLGDILVAATDKGVCAILLDDAPEPLVRDLQDRFPGAELIGGDANFEKLVARVVALVESPGGCAELLPLDIRGTAFQRRVWTALGKIPVGETLSYASVAERIGSPAAVRAVAGACAANALAVAIPCHRVVRADGALSGYRWGVERKRELLRREREG